MRRAPRSIVALTTLGFITMHVPVLVLAVFSFNRSRYGASWEGFTLDWYRRLAERPDILAALKVSLVVGGLSTAIATTIGTLFAVGMTRGPRRGAAWLESLVLLPIVTPEIVMGIGLLALFATLGIALGITTIVIAHVAFSIPFVIVVVRARLAGMDRTLEEAAMTLGATGRSAFLKVTLPLLWPGIIAAALLAFTMSIDDFVITFFVAGPGSSTLPLVIYAMARRAVEPSINAVSTLLVAASTLLILGFDRLSPRRGS
ncbi:MAG TPA: ABC transporter permease [Gemmatimonadales bacterium]|jgi:spermidine/putrescine transport system permease protein